jgi:hypothetical protein
LDLTISTTMQQILDKHVDVTEALPTQMDEAAQLFIIRRVFNITPIWSDIKKNVI